jgi:hypothetical protein
VSRGQARAAAAVGVGVDIAYVSSVTAQGADFGPRVVFLATFIAAMSALSLAAAFVGLRGEVLSQAFIVAAATGLLGVGALALASIGIFLIPAGLLAFVAAGSRRLSWRVVVAISVVVTAVFLGGIALT